MNLAIAIVLTAILWATTIAGLTNPSSRLTEILAIGIYLNALLAVFNLVPIPPLDGSRVVQYFLADETLVLYRRIERYGLFIIMGLIFFFPRLQILLGTAIFGLVRLITIPFRMTADVEPLLRRLLFQ
jgi:Zn-dependent protease